MKVEQTRIASQSEIARAETQFRQHLRLVGMKTTKQRSTIVRCFLQAGEPISARDLLYVVKKDDLFISMGTVIGTLKTLVACGMAKEVISPDGVTLYEHEQSQCLHRHLVCKDCGAEVGSDEIQLAKAAHEGP
jgi:Fe2+ or Zn2+ uptake regulation protein